MCDKDISPEDMIKLGTILSRKDRAPFKLECCHYIVEQVEKLEKPKTLKPDYQFKIELAVDCFLVEVISVMDSLLQEINDRMILGLPVENVNENEVDKELKDQRNLNKNQRKNILQDIWDIKNKNWLWRLKQYRNMTVHRNPLKFLPIYRMNMAEGMRFEKIMLQPIEGDPNPEKREVTSYFSECLEKMRKMVDSIEEKLNDYIL